MSKKTPNIHIYWLLSGIAAFLCSIAVFTFLLFQQLQTVSYTQALDIPYTADQVVILVNQERTKNGLPPLKINPLLTRAAQNKNQHMIEYNYFSHVSPKDGKKWSDFIKEVKYNYVEAGENLANGFLVASDMVEAWMNSPTHKANILAEGYKETGVAVNKGKLNGRETIFVTQMFGRTR
jgi:uncharacterized protein YkwD